MRAPVVALLSSLLCCAACTPALNWREVQPTGSGVSALFPCKPELAQRELDLGGRRRSMGLAGCEADGQTFSLAWTEMATPDQVGPALREMRLGLAERLGASPGPARPLLVAGMTPQPEAMQQNLLGARRLARVAVFAHGLRVYQAVWLGKSPDAAAWQTFVEALKLPT